MAGLLRSIAPGVALGGIALGLVAGFDRALQPASAEKPSATKRSTGGTDTAAGTSCSGATQVTGSTVQTRWGPVQVRASVLPDGSVCQSEAVVYPTGDEESIEINSYALPVIDEAVQQDGIAFDAVSGATVTSEGYRQSLQSVLDRL